MTLPTISLRYHRPPDRTQTFRQLALERTESYAVTFLPAAPDSRPATVEGRVILEPGAPIVWVSYPGRWYDVGRFHLADGTFTGFYANILTPVAMRPGRWETTDLALDVWLGADGDLRILDEDELDEALRRGWIDDDRADHARQEAAALVTAARQGTWPDPDVYAWTLDRALARAREMARADLDPDSEIR